MPIVVPYSAWGNIANLASAAGVASQQPASNALAMQVQQYNQSLVQRQQDEQDKQQAEQDKQAQEAQQASQYQQTEQRLINQAQGEQDYHQQQLKQQADQATATHEDRRDTQAAKNAVQAQKDADRQRTIDEINARFAPDSPEWHDAMGRLYSGSYSPLPMPGSGSGRVASTQLTPDATANQLQQQITDAEKEIAKQQKLAMLGDPTAVDNLKKAQDAAASLKTTRNQWLQEHGVGLKSAPTSADPYWNRPLKSPPSSMTQGGKPVPQSVATKAYAAAFATANGDPDAAKMLAAQSLAAQGYDPNTVLKGQ